MSQLIKLPGLIDAHVHLRDPGQTHKEDFYTGTSAALAGGFTTILDMPNNKLPITTYGLLIQKQKIAQKKIVCDVGFYFGSQGDNLGEFPEVDEKVFGIKLYLNPTTGNYLIDTDILDNVYMHWGIHKPILVHAEEKVIDQVIETVRKYGKKTHICHVSNKSELSAIIKAKSENLPITCGVCPHHLFLTTNDVKTLGPFGLMKPSLKLKSDQEFLWRNLNYVDVIESDHAPHTIEEKNSKEPPFGVPGLETTLPLLLTAVHEKRLTINDVIEKCHTNPAKIFNIPTDKNTYVEVDNSEFIILNSKLHTKCAWSPFDSWKVRGQVKRVFIRGKKVFENGKILAQPGSGKVIQPLF